MSQLDSLIGNAQKTDDVDIDECHFLKIKCDASRVLVDVSSQLLQMPRLHAPAQPKNHFSSVQ